jgi:hypothetical protein
MQPPDSGAPEGEGGGSHIVPLGPLIRGGAFRTGQRYRGPDSMAGVTTGFEPRREVRRTRDRVFTSSPSLLPPPGRDVLQMGGGAGTVLG